MNNLNIAFSSTPLTLFLSVIFTIALGVYLYRSKLEVLAQVTKVKRFLLALAAVILVVFLQLQITFPHSTATLKRFDSPVVTEITQEKITVPVDNVTKAKIAFEEQLKKSKEANAQ